MSTDTAEKPVKVVLDTNVPVSAVGSGGKPRSVLQLVLDEKVNAFTSPTLLAELEDVVSKKFPELAKNFGKINRQIKKQFRVVQPKKTEFVFDDDADNRVLETAIEGECSHIVTGDKELLELKTYRGIETWPRTNFLR